MPIPPKTSSLNSDQTWRLHHINPFRGEYHRDDGPAVISMRPGAATMWWLQNDAGRLFVTVDGDKPVIGVNDA